MQAERLPAGSTLEETEWTRTASSGNTPGCLWGQSNLRAFCRTVKSGPELGKWLFPAGRCSACVVLYSNVCSLQGLSLLGTESDLSTSDGPDQEAGHSLSAVFGGFVVVFIFSHEADTAHILKTALQQIYIIA